MTHQQRLADYCSLTASRCFLAFYRSEPSGNCLYSSVSLALVGDNSLIEELRQGPKWPAYGVSDLHLLFQIRWPAAVLKTPHFRHHCSQAHFLLYMYIYIAIEILSNPRRKWWDRVKMFTRNAEDTYTGKNKYYKVVNISNCQLQSWYRESVRSQKKGPKKVLAANPPVTSFTYTETWDLCSG